MQAALTRIGDPYVWGATGPAQFDCSGLMVWAYKQGGGDAAAVERVAAGGRHPVDRKDLRPGDLIIYYEDAGHVGMYVGRRVRGARLDVRCVPVKVVPIDDAGPYKAARRY